MVSRMFLRKTITISGYLKFIDERLEYNPMYPLLNLQ